MGSGASSDRGSKIKDEDESDNIDEVLQPVNAADSLESQQLITSAMYESPEQESPVKNETLVAKPEIEIVQQISLSESASINNSVIEGSHSPSGKTTDVKRNPIDYVETKVEEFPDDETDSNSMSILFQFIPYYGQGDPANDSTVRATLRNLPIEDIDLRDENGNTLLLMACQYRSEDLVRIMLNKGADPNALNASGACCLHFACYRDSSSKTIVKALIQNGASPEVKEATYGCTPLHYSASAGDLDICKLLISNGAVPSTLDYYNYSCVDYAREAGHTSVAKILQDIILKSSYAPKGLFAPPPRRNDWSSQIDPESGSKYYMNEVTGETLWEDDYLARYQQPQSQSTIPEKAEEKVGEFGDDDALLSRTVRLQLEKFLSEHDPAKIPNIDGMLQRYKGKEKKLLRDLCRKYNVPEEKEVAAFSATFSELSGKGVFGESDGMKQSDSKTDTFRPSETKFSGENGLSPLKLSTQPLQHSASMRLGAKSTPKAGAGLGLSDTMTSVSSAGVSVSDKELEMLRTQLVEVKHKYEAQVAEEQKRSQALISEKEGQLALLQAQLDSLSRDKGSTEREKAEVQARLAQLQVERERAMKAQSEELAELAASFNEAKLELASTTSLLSLERDKLRSLEGSLATVTAGDAERVEAERRAAAQRASEQQERDRVHAEQLAALQEQISRQRQENSDARAAWERMVEESQRQQDDYRKKKETEIEALHSSMATHKAAMARELSEVTQKAEAADRKAQSIEEQLVQQKEDNHRLQTEIDEARPLIALNAQLYRDLAREQAARKRLHNEMEDLKGKIRVYVRIRPFSKSELERGGEEAVVKDGKMSVLVKGASGPDSRKVFDFDSTFGGLEGNTQEDVFKDTKHLMMSVVDGYNVCIFAYGQTGSGKTYTMMGSADIANCVQPNGTFDANAGIMPRAVSELFRLLGERTAQMTYTIEVQMYQLYRDALEDLLAGGLSAKKKKKKAGDDDDGPSALKIVLAEHSPTGLVQVDGAESIPATSAAEVMGIVSVGSSRRTTACTQMNAESSRSHLIVVLVLKMVHRRTESQVLGKLTLVDLAGSERVDKSGAVGDVLKEAQSINKSLSALGGVIASLTTGASHVPYRDHALTMLMSDSIGGNAKTLMFVNCSPADYNTAESMSSLGFAQRCKDVTNTVSGGPQGAQQGQINALKKELAKLKKGDKAKAPKLEGLR